jgi:hypothetical protein
MDSAALVAWINEDFHVRATLVIGLLMLAVSGPPLGIAWYLWRIGARTLAAGRYPPPGVAMLRDLPVITGPAAVTRARLLRAFSAMTAVTAVLMSLVLLRFAILVWR